MFRSKKGLDGNDILSSLIKHTDGPKVIGKPGPTMKEIRAIMKDVESELDLEIECEEYNLARGKAIKN